MTHEDNVSNKEIKPISSRDIRFDGLRALGLLAIILAHVSPPEIIYQIRNFDVPLMILVSGIVFGMSSGIDKNYWVYILSRIRRLAVPTWIFLSIYFIYFQVINLTIGKPFPFSLADIIKSYTLTWGVGYVWIIRIFLLVAIIIPLFYKIHKKIKNSRNYLLILFVIYLIYELIFLYYSHSVLLKDNSYIQFIFQNYILNIVPYGCIAGLGLYLANASKKSILFLSGGFLIVFTILAIFYNPNQFTYTQGFKYPPQIYYLSYALFISLLLYLLSKTNLFRILFCSRLMLFIGRSSLWIYLWQILFLSVWGLMNVRVNISLPGYLIVFTFVVFSSVLLTYLQKKIIGKIIKNNNMSMTLKNILRDAFLK